jgi:Putative Flp pilus-assembly TadE/G-like
MSRLRHEAGQTVVLLAVLLPLFLGLGAIAVDVGYWYVIKKTAQDAADAAALAAARELPNATVAIPTGEDYVHRNMPDAVATVSTPYAEPTAGSGDVGVVSPPTSGTPDPMKIEVTVHQHAGTFFGRMFGVFDANVTARAVAERLPGDDTLAIFSFENPMCGDENGLEFDAENVRVNGFIHSNGRFRISRGPFWAADGTISRNNCVSSIEHEVYSQFGSAPPLNREPRDVFETRTWPLWHTPADVGWLDGCTYSGAMIEITQSAVTIDGDVHPHGGTLPSGTYCATTSFHLDGNGLSGRITVLSPQITVEGGDLQLRPFAQDVLFFAVPNSDTTSSNDGSLAANGGASCVPSDGNDLALRGSGHRWFGLVFNPCGRIQANLGGGLDGAPALEGALVGFRVLLQGNGFEMIGRGDFEYSTALVE